VHDVIYVKTAMKSTMPFVDGGDIEKVNVCGDRASIWHRRWSWWLRSWPLGRALPCNKPCLVWLGLARSKFFTFWP